MEAAAINSETLAVPNAADGNKGKKSIFYCRNRCGFVFYYILVTLDIISGIVFLFFAVFSHISILPFLLTFSLSMIFTIAIGFYFYGLEITVNYENNTVIIQNRIIHFMCSRCRKPIIVNRAHIIRFLYQNIVNKHYVSMITREQFILLMYGGGKSQESFYKSLPNTLYQFVFDKDPPPNYSLLSR